jgi:glycosyltransferase involved in cell wall biosynthesis
LEANLSDECAVSVIIPAKNAMGTIDRALRSIADQTFQPLEVIVVDNNSTDATVERARAWGDKIPVKVVSCVTPGSGAARNGGIAVALGTHIAFLDADDVWYPEKLQLQVDAVKAHGAEFLGTYMHYVTPNGQILGDNVRYDTSEEASNALLLGAAVPTPLSSVLVSKAVIDSVGGFDETFLRAQDFEWMTRVVRMSSLLIPVQTPQIGYVLAGGSSTDNAYLEQGLAADEVRSALRAGRGPDYETGVLERIQSGNIPRRLRAGRYYRRAGVRFGERNYVATMIWMACATAISPKETLSKIYWQVLSSRGKSVEARNQLTNLFT